jgi:hypothetical protein
MDVNRISRVEFNISPTIGDKPCSINLNPTCSNLSKLVESFMAIHPEQAFINAKPGKHNQTAIRQRPQMNKRYSILRDSKIATAAIAQEYRQYHVLWRENR